MRTTRGSAIGDGASLDDEGVLAVLCPQTRPRFAPTAATHFRHRRSRLSATDRLDPTGSRPTCPATVSVPIGLPSIAPLFLPIAGGI